MNDKQKHTFGLIGKVLGYSFSKKYFSQKFLEEGLSNCVYENFELEEIAAFSHLIKKTTNLKGLNVTIPYKTEVISFLDELDEAAKAIGAVNTIKIVDGKLFGYNTDVVGFENSIKPLLQKHHTKALILGTGGAAKAIQYVFGKMGIGFQLVSRRAKDNAISYSNINEAILNEHHIIVNTSPLGTFPDVEACADLPYQLLGKKHILYDLVYNPAETAFLKKGKEKGATIKNGLQMLQLQAEASWQIWNR